MKNKPLIKSRLFNKICNKIAGVYLYLLAFYFFAVFFTFFFKEAKELIGGLYWIYINIAIVILGLLSIISKKARKEFFAKESVKEFLECHLLKGRKFNKGDYTKILVSLLIICLVLYFNIKAPEFLILLYGLWIIVFNGPMRELPAMLAILMMIAASIFSFYYTTDKADEVAKFGYYFLFIFLIAEIKIYIENEYFKAKKQ